MSQNLLIAAKASSACDRFVRYKCSPWFVLAIAPLTLLFAAGVERTRVQIRWFSAIAQIDFVHVYELLNDLLW